MFSKIKNSHKKAAEKILSGDYSMSGFFLDVTEAENIGTENFKMLITEEELVSRAKEYLNDNQNQ